MGSLSSKASDGDNGSTSCLDSSDGLQKGIWVVRFSVSEFAETSDGMSLQ